MQNYIKLIMNILELQNLKKYYATQKAVDDISFQYRREAYLVCLDQMVQAKQHYCE